MGNIQYNTENVHVCSIETDLEDDIVKIPPHIGCIQSIRYKIARFITISARNPLTKTYFNSNATIILERNRHYRSGHVVTIHPLSLFALAWERLVCILWMVAFFKNSFNVAFIITNDINETENLDLIIDIVLLIEVVVNFLLAFWKNGVVILDPNRIILRYLKTYFFFDFFGTIPLVYIGGWMGIKSKMGRLYLSIPRILRFVRLGTLIRNMQQTLICWGIRNDMSVCICQLIMTLFFIHWIACLIYLVPIIFYISSGSFPQESWATLGGLTPADTNVSLGTIYNNCLLAAACIFFCAGDGMFITQQPIELLIFSIIRTLGTIYISYLMSLLALFFGSVNISETKYDELMLQLREFAFAKKISNILRNRLKDYFESRFEKKYFKEEALLNAMSEHLRYEIKLHTCRTLIEKVNLFQGLPKPVIGFVVGFLKPEVYLETDKVISYGDICNKVWFISFGTIALYNDHGLEIAHLEDGEYFGAISLILDEDETISYTAVASEHTELFMMEKKDFMRACKAHRNLKIRVQKYADRYKQMYKTQLQERVTSLNERKNILEDLRRGKILENLQERKTAGEE